MEYNRIIYPERAEYMDEKIYRGYKVFLDHWSDLVADIKSSYEETVLRKVSKTVMIYGDQSTGKTLFGNKIVGDFEDAQNCLASSEKIVYDENNVWHRMVSGFGKNVSLIKESSEQTVILHITDDQKWVEAAINQSENKSNRTCVVIADNCERDYFIQGLLGLSPADYLQIGRTDALVVAAAQKYVALCRGKLRGALLLMFTNDKPFAEKFKEEVNKQHMNLVSTIQLPMPSAIDKETVVRVNTNRLNPFSYWYCLDRAGKDEKINAYNALVSSSSFKESFAAIDRAIQSADATRVGRPPKKCLLTLFVMTDADDVRGFSKCICVDSSEENFQGGKYISISTYKSGWASNFEFEEVRQGKLLESEWNLRIVVVGNQFVRALLYSDDVTAKKIIDNSLVHHGPGTQSRTLSQYRENFSKLIDEADLDSNIQDLKYFWSVGQVRASHYERKLKEIFETYDTTEDGFLNYRPDYIVGRYKPCQLTMASSPESEAINEVIRRTSITCEFTAIKDFKVENVVGYLNRKLSNYVKIIQEQ